MILGLITVSQDQLLPSVPKKTSDTGFAQGKIYFRRGSQNAPASVQEQGQIWDWFRGRDTYPTQENPYVRERSWAEYLAEVEGFDQTARHILVVDQSLGEDAVQTLSGARQWTPALILFTSLYNGVGLITFRVSRESGNQNQGKIYFRRGSQNPASAAGYRARFGTVPGQMAFPPKRFLIRERSQNDQR